MIVKDKGYVSYDDLISEDRLTKVPVRDSRVIHFAKRRAGSPHGDLQLLLADGGLLFTWSTHGIGAYQVRLDPVAPDMEVWWPIDPMPGNRCPECGAQDLVRYPGHQATISMCGDNWQQDYSPLWVCRACFWISDMTPIYRNSPPVYDDGGREFDPYHYDRHPQ